MSFVLPILVGLACGVLSGFGIGGGSLLMLYMTVLAGVEQKTAQGINLLYFLPTAAIALLLHVKNRFVSWRVAIPAAIAGCLVGALTAWIAAGLDSDLLRKCFGGFLLLVGAAELHAGFKQKNDTADKGLSK